LNELAQALRIELRHAQRVVQVLHALGWIGELKALEDKTDSRYVLLADLQVTPLAPLAEALLVSQDDSSHHVWRHMGIAQLHVADVLPRPN
jgi:membrane protein